MEAILEMYRIYAAVEVMRIAVWPTCIFFCVALICACSPSVKYTTYHPGSVPDQKGK